MRFNRYDLNIYSFQTFTISSLAGFRAESLGRLLAHCCGDDISLDLCVQLDGMQCFIPAIVCLWAAVAVYVPYGVSLAFSHDLFGTPPGATPDQGPPPARARAVRKEC